MSFYGGRPGRSFEIIYTFENEAAIIADLSNESSIIKPLEFVVAQYEGKLFQKLFYVDADIIEDNQKLFLPSDAISSQPKYVYKEIFMAPKGEPFRVETSFPSIDEMKNLGAQEAYDDKFVVIDTGNVNDEDNGKLYFINGKFNADDELRYEFIADLSGATGQTGSYYLPTVDDKGFISWTIQEAPGTGEDYPNLEEKISIKGNFYLPTVDEDGNISWELIESNAQIENPSQQNIIRYYLPNLTKEGVLSWSVKDGNGNDIEDYAIPGSININGGYYFPRVDEKGQLTWRFLKYNEEGLLFEDNTIDLPNPVELKGDYYYPLVEENGTLSWVMLDVYGNTVENAELPISINLKGDYYYPTLAEDGTLSWELIKTEPGVDPLPVQEPINIKGQKGDKGDIGAGLSIVGYVETEADLPTTDINTSGGYFVNETKEAFIYLDGQWKNIGTLGVTHRWSEDGHILFITSTSGETESTNLTGGHYVPNVDENGDLTWTFSADLANEDIVSGNVKGPRGDKGDPGPKFTQLSVTYNQETAKFEFTFTDEEGFVLSATTDEVTVYPEWGEF